MTDKLPPALVRDSWTTADYVESVSAPDSNDMFTLAYQWQDKPHRHVWDLCDSLDKKQAEIDSLRSDLARALEGLKEIANGHTCGFYSRNLVCQGCKAMDIIKKLEGRV